MRPRRPNCGPERMNEQPVLILGGGINGAAAARELVLNGTPVWLVDTADLAFGATAYSSRLIHGGLRYLEFAEFALVRESLDERARLLRLAPHLVKPLRLFIPVRNQWGGLVQAASKFMGLPLKSKRTVHRGLRVVQLGLWLYDRYSAGGSLPPRSVHRLNAPGVPAIDSAAAKRLLAYSDAQIVYPERLVIDLLTDARELARAKGIDFRVLTYTRATLHGDSVALSDLPGGADRGSVRPAAIINATGAWVDTTLARLPVAEKRLMGGTKGSHFVTYQQRLAACLRGQAIYTEAKDGRPVFLLPFGEGTLVGTTDLPFTGDPATARATEEELAYLIDVVNSLFPVAQLQRSELAMHQCGVRPLPFVDASTPAAITRRHQLVWSEGAAVPLVSLVGGKLTTCRSLAEETAAAVLGRLGKRVTIDSRDRPISPTPIDTALISGTVEQLVTPEVVRQAVEQEWAKTLEDVAERRLMLHFSGKLSQSLLAKAADALVQLGTLQPGDQPAALDRCSRRFQEHFGVQL